MLIATKGYIYGYIYFIHVKSVRYYDASNYDIRVRVHDRCIYCDGRNHGISETETLARGLGDLPRRATINPYIGTELCSGFFIIVFLYPCPPGFLTIKPPFTWLGLRADTFYRIYELSLLKEQARYQVAGANRAWVCGLFSNYVFVGSVAKALLLVIV